MNIIVASTPMKSNPCEKSELETECLFGEKVYIKDKYLDWVYCELLTDNYIGWIKKSSIGKFNEPSHRVHITRSFVYENDNERSRCLCYLPMGSKLSVLNIESNWSKIHLPNKNGTQIGFVPSTHIIEIEHAIYDWVSKAEQLVGTPYKWGGRDTLGIDCSALLQLSYENFGFKIPRNTSEQINLNKKGVSNLKELKRGNVVFWKGHVGIMTDNKHCIHANAFHMKTVIEPLDVIIKRMPKSQKILKILDFNK